MFIGPRILLGGLIFGRMFGGPIPGGGTMPGGGKPPGGGIPNGGIPGGAIAPGGGGIMPGGNIPGGGTVPNWPFFAPRSNAFAKKKNKQHWMNQKAS